MPFLDWEYWQSTGAALLRSILSFQVAGRVGLGECPQGSGSDKAYSLHAPIP